MNYFNCISFMLFIVGLKIFNCNATEIVCYYDSSSFNREGSAKFSMEELELALPNCDYLIYGYVGIDPATFTLQTLDVDLDIGHGHFHRITSLKERYGNLSILLSVGGDKDLDDEEEYEGNVKTNKYLELLQDNTRIQAFVNCVKNTLKQFKFDGLDLAWQFNKDDTRSSEFDMHQFTVLTDELKKAFVKDNYLLTLTMLPNVKAANFINIPRVINNMNFVNLAAFDFQTPERNPTVADYPAPLKALQGRNPQNNVEYQVNYWLANGAPSKKLNIGIPAYGCSWKISLNSNGHFDAPINNAKGPATRGSQLQISGLLSWPEICNYGTHRYASSILNDTWVGYDDLSVIRQKTQFIEQKQLRGVALFDLSMDDFKSQCSYSVLFAIKKRLENPNDIF